MSARATTQAATRERITSPPLGEPWHRLSPPQKLGHRTIAKQQHSIVSEGAAPPRPACGGPVAERNSVRVDPIPSAVPVCVVVLKILRHTECGARAVSSRPPKTAQAAQDRVRRRAVFPMRLPHPKGLDLVPPRIELPVLPVRRRAAVLPLRSELNEPWDAARPSRRSNVTCWTTAQRRARSTHRFPETATAADIVSALSRRPWDLGRPSRRIRSTRSRTSAKSDERAHRSRWTRNCKWRSAHRARGPSKIRCGSGVNEPRKSDRESTRSERQPEIRLRRLIVRKIQKHNLPAALCQAAKSQTSHPPACRWHACRSVPRQTRTNGPHGRPMERFCPLYARPGVVLAYSRLPESRWRRD